MKKNIFITLALAIGVFGMLSIGGGYANACDCDCDKAKAEKSKAVAAPSSFDKAPAVGSKATCPVMGGEFVITKDSPRSEYKGKHYVFCCAGCKPKFDADPKKYIK